MTPASFLEMVLDNEIATRNEHALLKRTKEAFLPGYFSLKDFQIENLNGINQQQLNQLSELGWLEKGFNICLNGQSGTGKTHLACALGHRALEEGYSVSYITIEDLLDLIQESQNDPKGSKRFSHMLSSDLVIIDNIDYSKFKAWQSDLILSVLMRVLENNSTILISSNSCFSWQNVFGDSNLLMAVLDRFLENCEIIQLEGESYRITHRNTFLD